MPNSDRQIYHSSRAHIQRSISDELALGEIIWNDIQNKELFHELRDGLNGVAKTVPYCYFFLGYLSNQFPRRKVVIHQ
jgi:hypothetical protein